MYRCKRCLTELQGNSEFCVYCYRQVWRQCFACRGKGMVRNRKRINRGDPWMVACNNCKGTGWVFEWDGKTVQRPEKAASFFPPDFPLENGTMFG